MKKRILLSLVSFFAMTAMWANIQKNWNVYATADANGNTGETATLTLNLKNAEPVVNYLECTLELPQGVTFESATVISTRCPEGSNPELTTTPNSDGTVFISCELADTYAFTGTDGAVAAVTVAIAGDAPLGTCVVNVKNIVVSRTDGSNVNIPRKEFIWTIESIYTLIFDTNGSSEIASITQAVGTSITPPEAPTREGYTFMGWEPAIPETMPAGDMTVVAQWRINSYSLTYKVDGEVYKNYEVEYGSTITPESAPAKEGYTFSGWSEIPETMPAEDVTVTGSFTINSYTLTYKVDGIVYKKISVEYGTALIPEPVPAKRGMTFSGWGKVPKTMPAKNVTLKGTFSWSKETIEGVVYQVTDTLSNSASVVGYDEASAEATVLSDVEIDGYMYEVNSFADNALPKTLTINISVGKLLLWLWNNGYEDIRETESGRNLAAPEISLVSKTASSLTLSYTNEYPELSETVIVNNAPVEKGNSGYEVALNGLEPDKLYEGLASLTLRLDDASYTKAFSFSTEPLSLEPQQPKVINLGNVVVAAKSNLDDRETSVGFEWRRTDWTDEFSSNFGSAYLYEGTMEGYIRNLNTDRLWKYRAYYEANTGNRYYSQWIGIDPSNTSYFEPTVHTYSIIDLIGNMAEIWGYVMRGTDNITIQGFIYWNVTISSSSRKNAKGIPVNATKVLSSGNVMSAKLENLDYETTYCYVAFVTTSEGETFYGEPQTFRTGEMDEDGIKDIEHSPLNIEEAWYSLDGKKLSKPQKGINIIRNSDGTNKKVLVK